MRQSNRKAPLIFRVGLMLLCAMLVTTNMMGGLYARYSTTATGSASARVAKIDCAVNYDFSGYGDLGEIDGDVNGTVLVVMEEFSVENTGEVSYTYSLNLKLSKDIASATYDNPANLPTGFTLDAPVNATTVSYVYHNSDDSTTGTMTNNYKVSDLCDFSSFEEGKVYYAYSSDGASYTWTTATLNDGVLTVPEQTLTVGQQYYYKIIYFIEISPATNITQQQMTLLYKIMCNQID